MIMLRGDYRILNVLSDDEPRTFTQMLNESKLSRPVVSEYLKRLMASKAIRAYNRKYMITEKGKTSLQTMLIIKKTQGLPAKKIHTLSLPLSHRLRAEMLHGKYLKKYLPTMQEITTNVEVLFFLNAENRDQLDGFSEYFEKLANEVSFDIAEEIATKKYGKNPVKRLVINLGRLDRFKESFEWSKIFMGVEGGILIYFAPASKVDWEKSLKLGQRADGIWNMHILDYYADPDLRKEHLKLMIRWQIRAAEQLEQLPFEIAFWGKSPEEVRAKIHSVMLMLTELAKGTLYRPTKSEIEDALQEMDRDNDITIEKVYVPKLKPIPKTEVELHKEKETEPSYADKQLEEELERLKKIRKQIEKEVEELTETAIRSGELKPDVRSLSIEEKFNKVIHLKSFAP